MRIGVLGTGDVGRSLANGFLKLGHEVKMGSREPGNAKATAWAADAGSRASAGVFREAAQFGELLVLAMQSTVSVATELLVTPNILLTTIT